MATGTQIETKCSKIDIENLECSRSIENSTIKAKCTEHASEICQVDTAENNRDTCEKTGQTKKRYRSEKQRERTRQYKKKNRKAKKQMMREKKLAEKNSNDGHMIIGSLSFKPQGLETGTPRPRLVQTSRNKIEPESTESHKNSQTENLAEQVSLRLGAAVNPTKEAEVHVDKYIDKLLDKIKNDSLSLHPQETQTGCAKAKLLTQTEEQIKSENVGVEKNLIKEKLAEQISVQVNPSINLTTQAPFDTNINENIIPDDNNTKGKSVSGKLQKIEHGCATEALFSPSWDKIESKNSGKDNNSSKEVMVEPASVQLQPAVNITTEAEVDEDRQKDLIFDEAGDRQDIFGILSLYVDSSIHFDYEKVNHRQIQRIFLKVNSDG